MHPLALEFIHSLMYLYLVKFNVLFPFKTQVEHCNYFDCTDFQLDSYISIGTRLIREGSVNKQEGHALIGASEWCPVSTNLPEVTFIKLFQTQLFILIKFKWWTLGNVQYCTLRCYRFQLQWLDFLSVRGKLGFWEQKGTNFKLKLKIKLEWIDCQIISSLNIIILS